ncbi:hypothetical protein DITRI_Ditri14bG0058700 [Diplodiscus trichospermus]
MVHYTLGTVSTFITDQISRDEHLLRQTFDEKDVERIMQIPLSKRAIPDMLYWMHSDTGLMTVKSAYVLARSITGYPCPDQSQCNPIWKRLWQLNILLKLKVLMWRAINGFLPTAVNLRSRNLDVNVSLWSIPDEAAFWSIAVQFWHSISKLPEACIICWQLWQNRNKSYHESACRAPEVLVCPALNLLQDFLEANTIVDRQVAASVSRLQPPLPGIIKINVDAAFKQQSLEASVGIVARNFTEAILFSAATRFKGILFFIACRDTSYIIGDYCCKD